MTTLKLVCWGPWESDGTYSRRQLHFSDPSETMTGRQLRELIQKTLQIQGRFTLLLRNVNEHLWHHTHESATLLDSGIISGAEIWVRHENPQQSTSSHQGPEDKDHHRLPPRMLQRKHDIVLTQTAWTFVPEGTAEFHQHTELRTRDDVSQQQGLNPPHGLVPPRRDHARWLLLLLPIFGGLIMFLFTGNWLSLLFLFSGPTILIGQTLFDGRGGTTNLRRRIREYVRTVSNAAHAEQRFQNTVFPTLTDLQYAISDDVQTFWARSAENDELVIRLGTESNSTLSEREALKILSAEVSTAGWDLSSGHPPRKIRQVVRLFNIFEKQRPLPAILRLQPGMVVAVRMTDKRGWTVMNTLLMQLSILYPPGEVTLATYSGDDAIPHWLTWLPHHRLVTEDLGAEKDYGPGQSSHDSDANSHVTVMLMSDRFRPTSSRRSCTQRTIQIWVSYGQTPIPQSATHEIIILEDGLTLTTTKLQSLNIDAINAEMKNSRADIASRETNHAFSSIQPEFLSNAQAELHARTMAPFKTVTLNSDSGVTGPAQHFTGHVIKGDHHNVHELSTVLGVTVPTQNGLSEPLHLDMVHDGPHVLVAGTTGSGKSEFLQSWIVSLAHRYSPEDLTFLLIDYKGGATFNDFQSLPHSQGLVTDLNPEATERLMVLLEAEMKRRERLLYEHKAQRFEEFRENDGNVDVENLPRFVVVIDEYAALLEEHSRAGEVLTHIAARGRSLGIHLVLATQRPTGVVSAQLSANIGIKVIFRVRDAAESMLLLDQSGAERIPANLPGTAYISTEAGKQLLFRSRWFGPEHEISEPSIDLFLRSAHRYQRILERSNGEPSQRRVKDFRKEFLENIVERYKNIHVTNTIWLPPLSQNIKFDNFRDSQTQNAPTSGIVLGMIDVPQAQRQEILWFHAPHDLNLFIRGTAQSGKTTALALVMRQYRSNQAYRVLRLEDRSAEAFERWVEELETLTLKRLRVVAVVDDLDRLRESQEFAPGMPNPYQRLVSLIQGTPENNIIFVVSASLSSNFSHQIMERFRKQIRLGSHQIEPTRPDMTSPPGRGWLEADVPLAIQLFDPTAKTSESFIRVA